MMSGNMDITKICRTCLNSDYLNPIFSNGVDHRRYIYAVYVTTGVKIALEDGLPQNLCVHCIFQLNNALKFRKQCQDSDKQLLSFRNNLNVNIDYNEKYITGDSYHNISKETKDILQIQLEISENTLSDDNDDDDEKALSSNENPLTDQETDRKRHNNDDICRTEVEKSCKNVVNNRGRDNRVTCSLCQMELSVRSVAGHMARRHPGADGRQVKCDLCEVFVNRSRMNRHMLMMHGNEGFTCGYCKTDFESKDILLGHVSTCSAKKKKKRKTPASSRVLSECDVCHKTMQKASLRLHKAVKHAGLRPVCEHCGERFGNKYRLTEHYRAKHGYEKFKCSYCDFESAAIMAMRNHERRHRGEKPFVCNSCGAKFHAAYLLSQHNQSHRTEKLIKCEKCPARFKANNSLNMHKLTCHSSSLYKCSMCVRTYSCRHYAVKHLRQVHQFTGPVPRLQRVPAAPEDAVV